jgi:hypothetical protein
MKKSDLQYLAYIKVTPPPPIILLTSKILRCKNKFILASSLLPLQGAKT